MRGIKAVLKKIGTKTGLIALAGGVSYVLHQVGSPAAVVVDGILVALGANAAGAVVRQKMTKGSE